MNKIANNKIIKNIAIISLMAIFFIVDRYLKSLVLEMEDNKSYNLLGDIFSFSLAKNEYIAFSLPLKGEIVSPLIVLVILFLISIIFWQIFKNKNFILQTQALTFIVLGAISNMLDRFQYGYVIDYLNLKSFSIFNLADIMISLGTILFIYTHFKINKN